ncbi:MAG TPA: hypothetical protein VKU01_25115 [Bryobacteraceae bacterium]|nr:hypothetical protein [Bryobacteraceae bacterium]
MTLKTVVGLMLAGLFAVGVTAQNIDNSANGSLNGNYFVREVLLSDFASTFNTARARSVTGVIAFDGNGNYTFNGQLRDSSGGSQAQSYQASGQYAVGSNGLLEITNLIDNTDVDYGAIGAVGPNGIVASATEGVYNDILVAVPAGGSATNSSLQGNYQVGYIDYLQGNLTMVRDASFTLNANGQGSFGNVSVTGFGANLGSTSLSQTVSGATYSLSGGGTGTATFGSASTSQLISGSKTLYLSQDGNMVIGGDPNGFDLMVGFRALSGSASNGTFLGTYYTAALEADASSQPSSTIIDSFSGSTNANGQGASIWHIRYDEADLSGPFDFTFDDAYNMASNGTVQLSSFEYFFGANGQAFIEVGQGTMYSLIVGLHAINYTGGAVFLNPIGIVNAANFAPVTNSVAPGEYVNLYGTNLSSTVLTGTFPLQTTLGGVQVTINGRNAPILYVSQNEVTVIVPFATGPINNEGFATFQVINNGTPSNTVTVFTNLTAPGVLTQQANGIGDAVVQRFPDYSLINSSNPAKVGDTLIVYCVGLGSVTPAVADGVATPTSAPTVDTDVRVFIDNQEAQVTFKGLTPGYPALYQLNIIVPSGVTTGGKVYLDVSTPDGYTSEAKIAISQ